MSHTVTLAHTFYMTLERLHTLERIIDMLFRYNTPLLDHYLV